MKRLFLDDIRAVDWVYDVQLAAEFEVVRSYADFVAYIQQNGLPDFISFDNDLGLEGNGRVAPGCYAAAEWLVYESGLDLRELKFAVHSAIRWQRSR